MKTENVRKQLKISQNIWKMLWFIENANINIQSKVIYLRSFVLELHQQPISIFSKTDFA